MTKKLLLSAAAVAAMAFAGAAGAADITAGKISDVALIVTADGVTPYAIANEAKVVANDLKTDAAKTSIEFEMDSEVTIAQGAVVPFAVEFKLTGDAKFTSTPDFTSLKAAGVSPSSGVVVVGDQGKTLAFYVEYTGPSGGVDVDSLELTNLGISINSRSDVSISAMAKVTVAGFTQTVTELDATKIIAFKNALKPVKLEAVSVTAALSEYTEFGLSTGSTYATVNSNALVMDVNSGIRKNALGGDPLEVDDIVSTIKAVVTGPQVELLEATVAGKNPVAATLTATSAEYNLVPADLDGDDYLVLDNSAEEVIESGTYTVTLTPTFDSAYEGASSVTLDAIKVSLEGTNFYAPWFALNNGNANSTLRLANNGSAAVGPVIISLKSNNGTAAPTGTYTIESIPAGEFVSVTGTALKSAFGTDAKNGDLQVTIQANVANVSAKVRTTQSNGQTFENSVGATIDQIK